MIQRVSEAHVNIDGITVGRIGRGFLVLIGISDSDTEKTADQQIADMGTARLLSRRVHRTMLPTFTAIFCKNAQNMFRIFSMENLVRI